MAILEQVLKYNATFLILKITKVAYEKSRQKVSFDFKLSVIDEIHNGLISIIHAQRFTKSPATQFVLDAKIVVL